MLEGLNKLVDLQRLDSQLTTFEQEFSAIPGKRQVIAQALTRCDERLESAKEQLQTSALGQRRIEQELQEKEALLRRLEGQQNQVKSNVAYTALLHEMEQARQAISICETGILESMDAAEAAKETLAAEESAVALERKHLGVNDKTLDDREEVLAAQITGLREGRQQVCAGLQVELLDRYQKILARRQPALVLVTGEMCTGCRVGIPAQEFIEVLKAEKLILCGSCGRILLHPEKIGG